jgi:hypothetical protein
MCLLEMQVEKPNISLTSSFLLPSLPPSLPSSVPPSLPSFLLSFLPSFLMQKKKKMEGRNIGEIIFFLDFKN